MPSRRPRGLSAPWPGRGGGRCWAPPGLFIPGSRRPDSGLELLCGSFLGALGHGAKVCSLKEMFNKDAGASNCLFFLAERWRDDVPGKELLRQAEAGGRAGALPWRLRDRAQPPASPSPHSSGLQGHKPWGKRQPISNSIKSPLVRCELITLIYLEVGFHWQDISTLISTFTTRHWTQREEGSTSKAGANTEALFPQRLPHGGCVPLAWDSLTLHRNGLWAPKSSSSPFLPVTTMGGVTKKHAAPHICSSCK